MTADELVYALDYFIKAGLLAGMITAITAVGLRIVWRPF